MVKHQLESADKENPKSIPNFLLETLEYNSQGQLYIQNSISDIGATELCRFTSFDDLYAYLVLNPSLLDTDAGFFIYLTYDGSVEVVVYDHINFSNTKYTLDLAQRKSNLRSLLQYKDREPFNKQEFIDSIAECQNQIKEGNVYQANLSAKAELDLVSKSCSNEKLYEIYQNLTLSNPAPYSIFANFSDMTLISSSPESFLKFSPLLEDNSSWALTSSPIKGTASLDNFSTLIVSKKEHAEHIMIVDLIRNDLARIAKLGSVTVSELLQTHRFANLYHLISTIRAELSDENLITIAGKTLPDFKNIFKVMFPGGSITGAPKLSAINLISNLESHNRDAYTGAAGYFSFREGGELNILIRMLQYDNALQKLFLFSGAGITADSDPEEEYAEINLKAAKILEIFYS